MKSFATIIIALFFTVSLAKAQDTLYMYKAGVVMSKRAVADMDSITFERTYLPSNTGTLKDIDGNLYYWKTIGTQTWMVENLKVSKYRTGESISNVTDDTAWKTATFGAWCNLNNNTSLDTKYGKLYNWNAVMDSRNIAPLGWHIPTDTEWTVLENYLISNGYNYDGSTTGNKIAKSLAAKSDWLSSPNIGSIGNDLTINNSSGFTGLPGSGRVNGTFQNIAGSCVWWSTTEFDADTAWYRFLDYYYNFDLSRSAFKDKHSGFSVRCIKD